MRIMSILTACLVAAVLYGVVFERDRLLEFSREVAPAAQGDVADGGPDPADGADPALEAGAPGALPEGAVRVMAKRSVAQVVDSEVILRGETQAVRQVEVRAETSGKIVSEPLRKGSLVEAGQLLCEIDPGTSQVSLQEALARLAESKARLPEAKARLAEARAQLPSARARILEAEAAVPAAEAQLAEARANIPAAEARLAEARARVPEFEARLEEAEARVPEAEARLAEAKAAVPAAEARLKEAEAGVPAAKSRLVEAEARVPEAEARLKQAQAQVREAEINLRASQELARDGFAAQTKLAGAEAAYETALTAVQTAELGLKSAAAGIETAKSQLQGALAAVQTAKSQVETAKAAVHAAQSGIRNARAGVISAKAQIQNALAGVQSAQSRLQGAKAAVASALSGVEGAKAAVIAARAQLETATAGIQSAKTGEESALSAIQSSEAAVASARREIDRLKVHAPFAGLLETDTAELGALLQPGSACATVIQLNPIKIVGYVPETTVARVKLGAKAGARLTNGRIVQGEVTFVSRSADPTTRTFLVELSVDNSDLTIRDGETAEVAIEAEGAKAHLLPQSTLTLNDQGKLGVRTVKPDDSVQWMDVSILRDTRDGVWITGLPDEINVITVGQEYVTNGVTVVPSYEDIIQ
ncbi:efflux RND transporter periplasmic adaptor subunit [Mameliella alba]|uniref:efflux RND transporter periplasmic adaptor subunit n=1 Tax=Mameliella alba TaxID=561184 RepID=UPI001FD756FA|nr:efflux RND transporter periplasmic adaptor subunit [Mameliella alba]